MINWRCRDDLLVVLWTVCPAPLMWLLMADTVMSYVCPAAREVMSCVYVNCPLTYITGRSFVVVPDCNLY